jgi:hypothetical protein
METKTIREAVAVFDQPEALEDAISDLQSSGVDRADLSILTPAPFADPPSGSDAEAGPNPAASRGAVVSDTDLRQGRVLATGLAATIAGVAAAGATVATGGVAAAAIAAATTAGGVGIASTWIGRQLANEHDSLLDAQRASGGIVLWVYMRDPSTERTVLEVLRRHPARVSIHAYPVKGASVAGSRQSPPIVDQPARSSYPGS